MSFFHEPPPLDSDVPPPLDDKLRENDFDLDEEEIIIEDNRNLELPELPTDFNVFSSVATDENVTYLHSPPKLPEYQPPPADLHVEVKDCDRSESPETHDVAKEKESFELRVEVDEKQPKDLNYSTDESPAIKHLDVTAVSKSDEIDTEKPFNISDVIVEPDVDASEEKEIKITDVEIKVDDDDVQVQEHFECDSDDAIQVNKVEVAFTTETFHGSDSEFDDFTGFTKHDDIPESLPELKLDDDDDDDDFNDFETAEMPTVIDEPAAVLFEADFSGFNAFSETTEFNEFEDFKVAGFSSIETTLENQAQDDDDDDDFGDFSDFTQAPAPNATQLETQTVAFIKPANVNGVIDMMFPSTSSSTSEKPAMDSDYVSEQEVIKSDNFVNKFNDFDSTVALGYLYSNSKASQTLVKALGIDTRNILLGPQWNSSSSSNMPRFAANLSFNPIEPIKPSTSHSSSLPTSTEPKPAILQPTKAPTDLVPEAEFDWNSSGLVNPLDGPQSKPQQPHEPTVVQQPAAPPTHSFEDEPPVHVVDQEIAQVLEAEAKANASNKLELNESSAYQWSDAAHFAGPAATSNIVVRERTIKLPETHIFTPVKGTSPVAREVSRDASPAPDDSYFPKGAIVVKEYHDVEYSLEPKKRIDSDGDFDDFQSAQPTVLKANPPLNLLEPQKVENQMEIKWPEPGAVKADLSLLETTPTATPTSKLNFNLPLPPSVATVVSKKKEPEFLKPVIGTSPTEQNGTADVDDDFNDFQAAPPRTPQPKKPSNDQITLSPARLVANQSNQKSSWISSLDDDEISRIEAAFPKCKTDKKSLPKSSDDDWCDFVAVQPPSSQPPSMISSNTMSSLNKFSNGDADDWSDFVSVPAKVPSSRSSGAISSQFQSKPNFPSWNQPSAKPYVNHSTSFLTNDPKGQNSEFVSSNYPYVQRPSMTITNNFAYNFMGGPGGQAKPNGISTILPELDFAMPKNLINLPRSGNVDPGKK